MEPEIYRVQYRYTLYRASEKFQSVEMELPYPCGVKKVTCHSPIIIGLADE